MVQTHLDLSPREAWYLKEEIDRCRECGSHLCPYCNGCLECGICDCKEEISD